MNDRNSASTKKYSIAATITNGARIVLTGDLERMRATVSPDDGGMSGDSVVTIRCFRNYDAPACKQGVDETVPVA
jgi:hypothetical protein